MRRLVVLGSVALFALTLATSHALVAGDNDRDSLTGAELSLLAQLHHRYHHVRLAASDRLAQLTHDRALLVIRRGISAESDEWTRLACLREAARRPPMPQLAPLLLKVLAEEAHDSLSPLTPPAREAFLGLGDVAEREFEAACANGLIDRAPALADLIRDRGREVVPGLLARVLPGEHVILLLPWRDQFAPLINDPWAGVLRDLLVRGARQYSDYADVGDLPWSSRQIPEELELAPLAAFALAAWADADARPEMRETRRRWVITGLKQAADACGPYRPGVHWIRNSPAQLQLAVAAALWSCGETEPLARARQAAQARIAALRRDDEFRRAPRAWFVLLATDALLAELVGETEAALKSLEEAFADIDLPRQSGLERAVLADVTLLHARLLARRGQSAPDAICDVLERAAGFGLAEPGWLTRNPEFAPFAAAPRFAKLIETMKHAADAARQRALTGEADAPGGANAPPAGNANAGD